MATRGVISPGRSNVIFAWPAAFVVQKSTLKARKGNAVAKAILPPHLRLCGFFIGFASNGYDQFIFVTGKGTISTGGGCGLPQSWGREPGGGTMFAVQT
jgi:hypothetical protein